jgi:LmbE family N-acetylglucosaminyl deacetylase
VIVIETHADDAYLSLGAVLRDRRSTGEDVLLVTVYSGTRKRELDAMRYAHALGADWLGCGLVENDGGAGLGSRELPADIAAFLRESFGEEAVWPLGVGHPEHRGVASAAPDAAARYLDQPYARRGRWRDEVSVLLRGRAVQDFRVTHATDYRHHALFKDQARFMYYNPPAALAGNAQVVVR